MSNETSTSVAVASVASADPARTEKIAALFELALLLEQNPDLPIPFEMDGSHLNIMLMSEKDPRAALARIVRILPGTIDKRVWSHGENNYFDAIAKVGTIEIRVGAYRDQVCERIVTGTREVTQTVPDPSVEVPLVEVTKTVEDIEWVCSPLLSPTEVTS